MADGFNDKYTRLVAKGLHKNQKLIIKKRILVEKDMKHILLSLFESLHVAIAFFNGVKIKDLHGSWVSGRMGVKTKFIGSRSHCMDLDNHI